MTEATKTDKQAALTRLAGANARIFGAVLTKFEAKKAHHGYGYGYEYGYSYGRDAQAEAKRDQQRI